MELEQLRVFCAAAERRSFSAAAAELYISHSTVSRAGAELERELGAELFERSPRGAALTPAGRELLSGARRLLSAEAELRERVRETGGEI